MQNVFFFIRYMQLVFKSYTNCNMYVYKSFACGISKWKYFSLPLIPAWIIKMCQCLWRKVIVLSFLIFVKNIFWLQNVVTWPDEVVKKCDLLGVKKTYRWCKRKQMLKRKKQRELIEDFISILNNQCKINKFIFHAVEGNQNTTNVPERLKLICALKNYCFYSEDVFSCALFIRERCLLRKCIFMFLYFQIARLSVYGYFVP